jgi:hypothetical protein
MYNLLFKNTRRILYWSKKSLLTAWMVCKHRNACIFENEQPPVTKLLERIRVEAALWAKAGAAGLRIIIPTTWDVH